MRWILIAVIFVLTACARQTSTSMPACQVELLILGTGQDAGAPQIGNPEDSGWKSPDKRLYATSAALMDRRNQARYLFEATPDIRVQVNALDKIMPPDSDSSDTRLGLSGVFLTHAHIGHYAGLVFFGRESAGTKNLPVYAMPRMTNFLKSNGPWSQLVKLSNIRLEGVSSLSGAWTLSEDVWVMPFKVPHRDEYSETVGFLIKGPNKSAFFLPDIDSWEAWETQAEQPFSSRSERLNILDMVNRVDYAFLDGTFFDDYELPGRDMSKIPHPRVKHTMNIFESQPEEIRDRIYFIHLNHTNPIRFQSTLEYRDVIESGFNVARRGQRFCL